MNDDLISRSAFLERMMRTNRYFDVKFDIMEEPAVDAVEVVRCKECLHRSQHECPMYHEEDIEWDDDGYIESEVIEHDYTKDNGFCDRGERRTDHDA